MGKNHDTRAPGIQKDATRSKTLANSVWPNMKRLGSSTTYQARASATRHDLRGSAITHGSRGSAAQRDATHVVTLPNEILSREEVINPSQERLALR